MQLALPSTIGTERTPSSVFLPTAVWCDLSRRAGGERKGSKWLEDWLGVLAKPADSICSLKGRASVLGATVPPLWSNMVLWPSLQVDRIGPNPEVGRLGDASALRVKLCLYFRRLQNSTRRRVRPGVPLWGEQAGLPPWVRDATLGEAHLLAGVIILGQPCDRV